MNIRFVVRRADGMYYRGVGSWTSSLDRAFKYKLEDSTHASTCCLGARVMIPSGPIKSAAEAQTTIEILQVRETVRFELVDHGACEGCKRTKCGRS